MPAGSDSGVVGDAWVASVVRVRSRACASSAWLLALFVVLLRALPADAAVGLEATVDKTEASLEDQIRLNVSISGVRGLDEPPRLPPLPDFLVQEGGTSTRTEIVNGRISSSVDFSYTLTPRRPGRFTIGPVTVTVKGETYQSDPIAITIHPPEKASPDKERTSSAYVTQEVDIPEPYVNQQVIYTFRFFTRLQTVEAHLQAPSFQGFWVEDLGKERQYTRVINGIQYSVTEIKKALFPSKPGPAAVEESLLTCTFLAPRKRARGFDSPFDDSFFAGPLFGMQETVTKTLRADPLTLTVRPLPAEGRPENFQGLVGTFQIEAALGQQELKVGDSTTLTVTVRGRGNLRDLADVPTGDLPGVRVYPDNPSFELQQVGDAIEGTKVFKKALVPLEQGRMEIRPLEVSFFDPSSGTYKTARSSPLSLSVLGHPEGEAPRTLEAASPEARKVAVKSLGEDILPIHEAVSAVLPNAAPSAGLPLAIVLCAAPPVVFATTLGIKRRKERLATDRSYARRREARRNARAALGRAKQRIQETGDKEFFRELARSIKGFIGDKANLSTLAMTPAEVEERTKALGLDAEASASVRRLLEELEYCQYVTSPKTPGEREALFKKTKNVLGMLERKL
jgi:DNA-dependent RNA polymerase auxiliary subunit epsilon